MESCSCYSQPEKELLLDIGAKHMHIIRKHIQKLQINCLQIGFAQIRKLCCDTIII